MSAFMVICKFDEGTDMAEVMSVVPAEQAQVAVLSAEGRLGSIYLAFAHRTVFIEVFAQDEAGAVETIRTLPMAKWWTLDIYPLAGPPTVGAI